MTINERIGVGLVVFWFSFVFLFVMRTIFVAAIEPVFIKPVENIQCIVIRDILTSSIACWTMENK